MSASAFISELNRYGLDVRALGKEGSFNRCRDLFHKKKKKDGWYWYAYTDSGVLYGRFGSWLRHDGTEQWNSRGEFDALPYQDRHAIQKLRWKAERDEKAKHSKAAEKAEDFYNESEPCEVHPYLAKKNVASHGLRKRGELLIIPAYQPDGKISSYQSINADGEKRFMSGGAMSGATFTIGEIQGAPIVAVAEGYSTAATIHELTGWPCIVAFSAHGLKKTAPSIRLRAAGAELIFCGDNDKNGVGLEASRSAAQSVEGIHAVPPKMGDWNDYSAEFGASEAKETLLSFIPPPKLNLPLAGAKLNAVIKEFVFDKAAPCSDEAPPPVGVIKVTMGGGKTHVTHENLPTFVKATGRQVLMAVPTHKLGLEQIARLIKRRNISVRLWHALNRDDPDAPGELMCRDYDLAKSALDAGYDLADVCKVCPVKDECGYQKQTRLRPDMWIFNHEMLFRPMPAAFMNAGILVIDEDIRGTALEDGYKGQGIRLAASTLSGDLPAFLSRDEKKLLSGLRALLSAALNKATYRRELQRFDFDGLTGMMAAEALDLECRAFNTATLPDGDRETKLQAIQQAREARYSRKVPLLWRLVRDFLMGGDEHCPTIEVLPNQPLENGEGSTRKIAMRYRRNMPDDWQLPTLILDATADIRVIKQMFPSAEMLANIEIEAPYQMVVRVTGKTMSKTSLLTRNGASDNVTRENTLAALHLKIKVQAAFEKSLGVLCNKDVEEALLEIGPLPSNVVIDHFNNTKGRNDWEDCSALFIIGRPLPDMDEVRRQARAFSGSWDCGDLTDAFMWQICHAELIQSIGRGRGVRRTADNPITIYLLNDIPLKIDTAKTVTWRDFQTKPIELLASRGLVIDADTSAKGYWNVIAAMAPDLYPTKDAAKQDGHRLRLQTSIGDTIIEDCYRKNRHWHKAEAKAGDRGWIPIRFDPSQREMIEGVLSLKKIIRLMPFLSFGMVFYVPLKPTLLTQKWHETHT